MSIDPHLLEILVCPQCKGAIEQVDAGAGLLCTRCKLKYQVRDGIPIMLVDEAFDLRAGANVRGQGSVKLIKSSFRITQGPDKNLTFQLDMGTCRAIGRGADTTKTAVFNVDLAMALDDTMRTVVQGYVSKQFAGTESDSKSKQNPFGQFRRLPDIVLTDQSLSRLHAMLFYHEEGIAVLDLVSKNGTFVNGKEVESKLLSRGDAIELGETTIIYEG